MTDTPFTNDVELLVLEKIEEHRAENGIIVVEESNYSVLFATPDTLCEIRDIRFIPYPQIEKFNSTMRKRIDGTYIVGKICQLLLEHYGKDQKPVVYLRRDGTNWVGMMGDLHRLHAIDYLNRCLETPYGDPQS